MVHVEWAAVGGPPGIVEVLSARVGVDERLVVDAIGEVEDGLQVRLAGGLGPRGGIAFAGPPFAVPRYTGVFVGIILVGGAGLVSQHVQVLRDGDLGAQ